MRNFPAIVREVTDDLKRSKDERLETMLSLSPTSEHELYIDIKNMWKILSIEEGKLGDTKSKDWVLNFLDAVHLLRMQPKHSYLSNEERKDLINQIKKHTKKLKKLYVMNGLNADLISNDGQFFHGFVPEEGTFIGFGKKEKNDLKVRDLSKVSIAETLDFFEDFSLDEIQTAARKGKKGKTMREARFIRELAKRNQYRYGDPLYSVIQTATEASYGHKYGMPGIHTLIKGRRS